jgi:hypothetical protein
MSGETRRDYLLRSDFLVPHWCIEGGQIMAPGNYQRRILDDGTEQVLTTMGWLTPLEPAEGAEPTAWPALLQ